jgi:hypothetical protein
MVEHYLQIYTNSEQTNWPQWILLAQHVYNNSQHNVTGKTLMELLMGFWEDL